VSGVADGVRPEEVEDKGVGAGEGAGFLPVARKYISAPVKPNINAMINILANFIMPSLSHGYKNQVSG
jgi:hypothetical protein